LKGGGNIDGGWRLAYFYSRLVRARNKPTRERQLIDLCYVVRDFSSKPGYNAADKRPFRIPGAAEKFASPPAGVERC
jgi:hypothetical protein